MSMAIAGLRRTILAVALLAFGCSSSDTGLPDADAGGGVCPAGDATCEPARRVLLQTKQARDRGVVEEEQACATPWAQCGGIGWKGTTCCIQGYSCQYDNDWWSACKPGAPALVTTAAAAKSTKKPPPAATTKATSAKPTTKPPSASTTKAAVPPAAPTTVMNLAVAPPPKTTKQPTAPATATSSAATTTAATTTAPGKSLSGTGKRQGIVTMWSSTNQDLIGSQCEYANSPVNSLTDSVLPSYLRTGFHCALGDSNPGFGKGEYCGTCWQVTSLSDNGQYTTPGKMGSAIVMISNGGAGGDAHFDCILPAFTAITGAPSDIFDVEFQQVPCQITGTPVIIQWADPNLNYCKLMFENIGGWGQLQAVKACLGGTTNCAQMSQLSGATWTGCPIGSGSSMSFSLAQVDPSGVSTTIQCVCAGAWPWPLGQRCTCQTNFPAVISVTA